MLVRPTDETIHDLLRSAKFFRIPRFQRPYSWDRANTEDFWKDAVTSSEAEYFIGSFVVYEHSEKRHVLFVVDGQQRMTTITIIFAALRDVFDDKKMGKQAKAVQGLIEKDDVDGKADYVLRPSTSHPFFQDVVQRHGPPQHDQEMGEEELALSAAYDYFRSQLEAVAKAVDEDPSIAEGDREAQYEKRLYAIRDAVLRLRLILVTLTSEDDAYIVFETLNTRGKDLGVSDLVKNHLARLLQSKNKGLDDAKERWTKLRRSLEGSAGRLDVDAFLHHSWISRRQYLPRAKLFKQLKADVPSAALAKKYLGELEVDAQAYRAIMDENGRDWTKQQGNIADSIRALRLFGVRQPLPLLVALIRSYDSGDLTKKQTEMMFRRLENFHTVFTGVTSKRTGGGTAAMYAAAARAIFDSKSKDERQQAMKDFTQKLKDRMPTFQEFESGLGEVVYFGEQQKDRNLVKYLLTRIDQHLRGSGVWPDYDKLTIEHVLPQNPADRKKAVSLEIVGCLGNLTLLPATLNNKVANKLAKDKIVVYRRNKIPLGPILEDAKDWDELQVGMRQAQLAKLLYEEILKV